MRQAGKNVDRENAISKQCGKVQSSIYECHYCADNCEKVSGDGVQKSAQMRVVRKIVHTLLFSSNRVFIMDAPVPYLLF